MKNIILGISFLLVSTGFSQEALSNEAKINLATHFLPEKDKNEAKVIGYADGVEMTVLRDSKSYLTCVADDPNKDGIQIVCYYTELEDFFQRGRVLKSEGKSPIEVREIRKVEIDSGELDFPKGQSMMYVFSGKEENLDVKTGVLEEGKLRYVIYIPYATQESTGLPLSPSAPGMPWIMDPGTHRAHIMVMPN
ncbi:hypothetical protein ERX46_05705 [Brumimicrobium glaciale]|uniref:Uncharacterized protein n=1 Tax=Brumimicrobium glaciale TaxID=200475 RepID=A0A4Q4KPD2_9FLAO|nr:hypothetical protein [Brumimicrobium glaciale]RYM34870.1 hypothetical protein ERX46_05705 [Brumimicrobium glaciale]